jgi:hypothetical protein
MERKFAGGCACGAVRYEGNVPREVGADPVTMLNCRCRDCRRAGGSAYAAIVVPKAAVRMQGELRYHRTVGDGGKAVERGFCPACGSQVALKLERLPDILGLHAASLDDPTLHKPAMDIFTASAQPWDHMAAETRKLPQGFATSS